MSVHLEGTEMDFLFRKGTQESCKRSENGKAYRLCRSNNERTKESIERFEFYFPNELKREEISPVASLIRLMP